MNTKNMGVKPNEIPGRRVRVRDDITVASREYMPEAWPNRRPGAAGLVIAYHDSHGVSFEVRHDDGVVGHYDEHEVELDEGGRVETRKVGHADAQKGGLTDAQKGSLTNAIEIVQAIVDKTTCPDPGYGGCIGGLIPGYGCIHEAASSALRRLHEVESNRRA